MFNHIKTRVTEGGRYVPIFIILTKFKFHFLVKAKPSYSI